LKKKKILERKSYEQQVAKENPFFCSPSLEQEKLLEKEKEQSEEMKAILEELKQQNIELTETIKAEREAHQSQVSQIQPFLQEFDLLSQEIGPFFF